MSNDLILIENCCVCGVPVTRRGDEAKKVLSKRKWGNPALFICSDQCRAKKRLFHSSWNGTNKHYKGELKQTLDKV